MGKRTSHTRKLWIRMEGAERLIVVHAGGVEGWLEGADLVLRSKTSSTDYHDKMNSEHYMGWFTKQCYQK